MKMQLIETALTHSRILSIGTWYVKQGLERHGHDIDVHNTTKDGYDVELISAHHITGYKHIVTIPKKSPVRIIGGHALYSNHRPLTPFADYLCMGEWDNGFSSIEEIRQSQYVNSEIFRQETTLPPLMPYLNHEGTRSKSWYIEIARGCPHSCHYCELGHSQPYRRRVIEDIKHAIDACDFSITRKVNVFAPDEASHPDYDAILEYITERGGYPSGFGSMRVEKAKGLKCVRDNMLIRVGIDGLTEERRFSVGKRISDKNILDYFKKMIDAGHSNFKIFMIFGYEGEILQDFDKFARIMNHVFRLDMVKNVSLRIKWTPFIPQPRTPLAKMKPQYNYNMVKKIKQWHELNRRPIKQPGFFVENDGVMSARSHYEQCQLMLAGEEYFL